jgi:hypothetical protein
MTPSINIFRATKTQRLTATVLGSEGIRNDYADEAVVFFDDSVPILYIEKDEMWTALHVIKRIWSQQPLGEELLDHITTLRGNDLPDFLDKLWEALNAHPNNLASEFGAHG